MKSKYKEKLEKLMKNNVIIDENYSRSIDDFNNLVDKYEKNQIKRKTNI